MKRTILMCAAAVVFAGSAWAQDKAPKDAKPPSTSAPAQGGAMDMSKMGPMARKPTNEQQTKKEIQAFLKQQEALGQKGDLEGLVAAVDFPIYMLTDDMKGMPEAKEYSREQYVAMMKPFYENMPKDMKVTHKANIYVLSDSLANVTDDFSITMGKQKMTGRNAALLVKRDGQWKWKSMVEAGWGGMPAQGAGGSGPTPTEGKQ